MEKVKFPMLLTEQQKSKLDTLILLKKQEFEELIRDSKEEDVSEVIKETINNFIEQQIGISALEICKMKYIKEQFKEYL